jgi:integrase
MRMKITVTNINNLALSSGKPIFIYDESIKGFGVKITKTKKVFFAEARVKGRSNKTRVTIGTFPILTVYQARDLAKDALAKMAQGINPNIEKKQSELESVTLQKVFDEYLEIKTLKPRTIRDYKENMRNAFPDWKNKPLISISKKNVQKRHTKLGERSHARANNAMRMLRAIFNFAISQYEDEKGLSLIPVNPVSVLTQMKLWYHVGRKQTVIAKSELKDWFKAVINLKGNAHNNKADIVRGYILFLLFTGLRRTEAATLKWENINFKAKTFNLPDTKNKKGHSLPLSDFLIDLLSSIRAKGDPSPYIFPGKSKKGHIVEPKRWIKHISDTSGVKFSLHDLRRTFATIAESIDIPAYSLKTLLNHSMQNSDVTAGYLVISTERLRKPMQNITDTILRYAEIKSGGKLINLNIKHFS